MLSFITDGNQNILSAEENDLLIRSLPKSRLSNVDYISYCQKIEFLLLTVSDLEFDAATTYFQSPSAENSMGADSATNLEPNIVVGTFAGAPVALIKVERREFRVQYWKDAWFPSAKYIIKVGTGYGFQRNMIELGDIFISSSLTDVTRYSLRTDGHDAYIDFKGSTKDIENLLHRVFCGNTNVQRKFKIYFHSFNCHVSNVITGINMIETSGLQSKHIVGVHPFAIGGDVEGRNLLQLQEEKVISGFVIIKSVSEYVNGIQGYDYKFRGAMTALHYVEQKLILYIGKFK